MNEEQIKTNHKDLDFNYKDYLNKNKQLANSKIDKYYIFQQIGAGQYAAIYRGMNGQTKKQVAIKVIDIRQAHQQTNLKIKRVRIRLIDQQSKIMMRINSRNVLKCQQCFQNRDIKIMIIEYCNQGTLGQKINQLKKIPEQQAIYMLKQILNGLSECHKLKIIHRDLKPDNILIHNGQLKIADFGFSKKLNITNENDLTINTILGTPTTMAPQVLKKQQYGLKADIWSIGVIFFWMIFGICPFKTNGKPQQLLDEMTKKLGENIESFNGVTPSQKVKKFLKQVLVIDIQKRLGWRQVQNHEIFTIQSNRLPQNFYRQVQIKNEDEQLYDMERQFITQSNITEVVRGSELKIQNQKSQFQQNQDSMINEKQKLYKQLKQESNKQNKYQQESKEEQYIENTKNKIQNNGSQNIVQVNKQQVKYIPQQKVQQKLQTKKQQLKKQMASQKNYKIQNQIKKQQSYKQKSTQQPNKQIKQIKKQVKQIKPQIKQIKKQIKQIKLIKPQINQIKKQIKSNKQIKQNKKSVKQQPNKCQRDNNKNQNNLSNNYIQHINKQQIQILKNQINKQQEELYQWALKTHAQCLKTQTIFNNIVQKIQYYNLLDINNRDVIQMMYLLCTRCRNNISPIYVQYEKRKNSNVLKQIRGIVQNLYKQVTKKWVHYSNLLTNKQNQKLVMFKDWFSKKIFKQNFQLKDRFLTGVQSMVEFKPKNAQQKKIIVINKSKILQQDLIDYTKEQQIQFTNKYVQQNIKNLVQNKNAIQLRPYMAHFKQICEMKFEDLKIQFFMQRLKLLLHDGVGHA